MSAAPGRSQASSHRSPQGEGTSVSAAPGRSQASSHRSPQGEGTPVRSLSIVVPVLDEAGTLAARLQALAPLRARGAELLVVDGGSGDGTRDIAQAHADRVLRAPRGRATQLNAGARAATGEVLLFLHADTQLPPEADRLIGAAIASDHVWGRFDVRIEGRHALLPMVAALMNLRSRWSGIATGDQALFVRRRVFESLGGFAPLPLMEDIDLSRRLKRIGPPACLREPVTTSGRRWDRNGFWRTVGRMWRLRAAFALGADAHALAQRYGYTARAPAAVAILAKAPVPGLAKTRLVPALGAAGAARAQPPHACIVSGVSPGSESRWSYGSKLDASSGAPQTSQVGCRGSRITPQPAHATSSVRAGPPEKLGRPRTIGDTNICTTHLPRATCRRVSSSDHASCTSSSNR